MTNDVFQNRFLALPDYDRLPAELAAHLQANPTLVAWVNRARELDRLVGQLPVPSSEQARLSFLESISVAGPVIQSIPTLNRPQRNWSLVGLLRKVDGRIAAGLAAATLVGVGIWGFSGPKPTPNDTATGPRHELLAKTSVFVADMAKATTPQARLSAGAQLSQELQTEVADLYKVAREEDLDKLAEIYEKVLAKGITEPARNLPRSLTAQARFDLLKQVNTQLATTIAETTAKSAEAPQGAVKPLNRIVTAARSAQTKVQTLIDGGA